jgi:hypothetical protein
MTGSRGNACITVKGVHSAVTVEVERGGAKTSGGIIAEAGSLGGLMRSMKDGVLREECSVFGVERWELCFPGTWAEQRRPSGPVS